MRSKKQDLEKQIKKVEQVILKNNLSGLETQTSKLKDRLDEDVLRLSVIGEFNHGKSTFINAFLNIAEENWLKMDLNEATSVLTEIKYGTKVTAKAYSYDDKEIEFDLGKLKEYTTGKNAHEKYHKVIIELPNKLLSKGVTFIDTPGVNSLDETKIENSFEAIKTSHAAIYITNRTEIPSKQIDYLVEAFGKDIRKLFFLCNPNDNIEEKKKYFEGIKNSINTLKLILSNKAIDVKFEKRVFLISAITALKARVKNDSALYKKSGLQIFEAAFWNFIIDEKYEIIYERQKKHLKKIIQLAIEQLTLSKNSLDFDAEKYDEKINKLNKSLKDIKKIEKDGIIDTDQVVDSAIAEFRNSWDLFIQKHESYIYNSISRYTIDSSFKNNIDKLINNLKVEITQWIYNNSENFKNIVNKMITESENNYEERLSRISQKISGDFELTQY